MGTEQRRTLTKKKQKGKSIEPGPYPQSVIKMWLCINLRFANPQLKAFTSLIKEILGQSSSVIGSTGYINKAILCSGNKDQWRSKKGKAIPVTGRRGSHIFKTTGS
jgi:hypothetical protein